MDPGGRRHRWRGCDDHSWYSVSMSSDGTRVAIGALGNDGGDSKAGHVRVYEESGGTWTKVGDDIDGEAVNDYSGDSVSISSDGTRVAIGAHRNDGAGSKAGHVRVYVESGGTWTQVGDDIDGEAANDYGGYSASISSDGTRGDRRSLIPGDSNAGHVCVYEESGGTWTKVGDDIDGEAANDYSGDCIDIRTGRSGHRPRRNDGAGTDVWPRARVLGERRDVRWATTSTARLWMTVLVLGVDVLRHARGDRRCQKRWQRRRQRLGHVRVYKESGGTWTKVGDDIDGEAAKDYSGWSVSISSDGTRSDRRSQERWHRGIYRRWPRAGVQLILRCIYNSHKWGCWRLH